MFGIGMPELLVILAVALIVIGPKKLPDLAKSLGRAMGEFKRATNDLKQSIEQETGLDEVRKDLSDVNRELRSSLKDTTSPYPGTRTRATAETDTSEAPADQAPPSPPTDADPQPSGPDGADDPQTSGKNRQP